MRTQRTNGTTTYSYVYNGGQLSQMKVGETTLNFTYDAAGIPLSVTYGDVTYYYVTDLQGDVVAIVDTAGVKVVEYLYDAWGRLLTTGGSKAADLGLHNPLRYRGYVYDPESGLYYLQSRYYNPELGRFLSSDVIYDTDAGLQGFNLFLYCGNNPTNRVDASGKDSIDLIDGDKEDEKKVEGGPTRSGNPTSECGPGNGEGIRLHRAVCNEEFITTVKNQKFSAGNNSYEEGKFFADTYENAQNWGNQMYNDGNYRVMTCLFKEAMLDSPSVIYYKTLDGVGAAYFIPIEVLNQYILLVE